MGLDVAEFPGIFGLPFRGSRFSRPRNRCPAGVVAVRLKAGKDTNMAVPRTKLTRSRRNNRRSHDWLRAANRHECPNCGELKRPHHVCQVCGYYDDRQVVAMSEPMDLEDDVA